MSALVGVTRPALELLKTAALPDGVHAVDVGARWGSKGAWWRLDGAATVHSFEPDVEECERLNVSHAPDRFYPYALGDQECTGKLYVANEPGGSSLLKLIQSDDPRISPYPLLRGYSVVKEVEVPVVRFRTWVWQHSNWPLMRNADFFKLDTQGYELHVLQGLGPARMNVLAVETEVLFAPMYEGQCYFGDVDRFLRGMGMCLWRLNPQVHYARNLDPRSRNVAQEVVSRAVFNNVSCETTTHAGNLFWANAVYFRSPEAMSTSDWNGLIKLAAFMEAAGDRDGAIGALQRALEGEPRGGCKATRADLESAGLRLIHAR